MVLDRPHVSEQRLGGSARPAERGPPLGTVLKTKPGPACCPPPNSMLHEEVPSAFDKPERKTAVSSPRPDAAASAAWIWAPCPNAPSLTSSGVSTTCRSGLALGRPPSTQHCGGSSHDGLVSDMSRRICPTGDKPGGGLKRRRLECKLPLFSHRALCSRLCGGKEFETSPVWVTGVPGIGSRAVAWKCPSTPEPSPRGIERRRA